MPRIYANRSYSNGSSIVNTPLPTCPYGEVRVTQRTSILDLKSTFGVSALREYVTVANGGTVLGAATTGTGEYSLNTTIVMGSAAALQSAERGAYQSGFGAETGMGIRLQPNFPVGQVAKWGFYDGTNGFYWQYDTVNKLSCNILRGGTTTQIVQSNFNTDLLDGTGPSTLVFDASRGNVFHILFSWYGYGSINFSIVMTDANANQCVVPVHQFCVPWSTSTVTPHLPIRAEITNVSSLSTGVMYLGGRQYCVLGNDHPPKRYTTVWQQGAAYSSTATRTLAIRRKQGYTGTRMCIQGIDCITTSQAFYAVYQAATVVGGTWTVPTNMTASETGLEANTSFTLSTGGNLVYSTLFDVSLNMAGRESMDIAITEYDIFVVELTAMSGSGKQSVIGNLLRVEEEW